MDYEFQKFKNLPTPRIFKYKLYEKLIKEFTSLYQININLTPINLSFQNLLIIWTGTLSRGQI